jgi:thiol reductant ABC exporter CydD subunit
MDAIEAWVGSYRPAASLAVVVPVAVLVVVAAIDPPSALVLLVTGPVLVALLALIGARVGPATAAREADLRWMQGYFANMLRGLATLRAFGRSREQADRIREIGLRYGTSTMAVLRTAFQASLVLEWGAAVAMALVAVELSLRLMTAGIGFEATLAVLIMAPEFFLPLRRLATHYHEGAAGAEAAARVLAILEVAAPGQRTTIEPSAAEGGGDPGPSSDALGDIVFERVSVAYPGRPQPALADLDLVLPAGCRISIVGPSGAGKSTLVALLLRFIEPDTGRIAVGGLDLATVPPARWRARIAYVPQAPHLFHGSVADNIRLPRPEADLAAVVEAARAARADAFIDDLPDGYATLVGEDGVRLSGGQRQRIALARAFLRGGDLVVLDEPTAHLDPEAEAAVASALGRLAHGRTVVVVSHRAALADGADVLIRLERGRVIR